MLHVASSLLGPDRVLHDFSECINNIIIMMTFTCVFIYFYFKFQLLVLAVVLLELAIQNCARIQTREDLPLAVVENILIS